MVCSIFDFSKINRFPLAHGSDRRRREVWKLYIWPLRCTCLILSYIYIYIGEGRRFAIAGDGDDPGKELEHRCSHTCAACTRARRAILEQYRRRIGTKKRSTTYSVRIACMQDSSMVSWPAKDCPQSCV